MRCTPSIICARDSSCSMYRHVSVDSVGALRFHVAPCKCWFIHGELAVAHAIRQLHVNTAPCT